jgi:hypothetical protein
VALVSGWALHAQHRAVRSRSARARCSAAIKVRLPRHARSAMLQPMETSEEPLRSPVPLGRDVRTNGPAADTRGSPGGAATVEEMSESSFPASDPPSTWIWEVPEAP